MTSQPGQKTITIHILPNISRNNCNQTMKFGQLTELTRKTFLFKTHAENRAGGLVPDLFFLKKKDLYDARARGLRLSLNIFR